MEPAGNSRRCRPGTRLARAQYPGGADDARAAPASEGAANRPARVIRFCPECRGRVQPSFHFCPYCGGSLPAGDAPEDRGSREELAEAAADGPGLKKREAHLCQGDQRKKAKCSTPGPSPPPSPSKSLESFKEQTSPGLPGKGKGRSPRQKQKPVREALPEAWGKFKVLTDIKGQGWRLGSPVLTWENGPTLFEAMSVSDSETALSKQRFSLKLDFKNGRLFHEQNFFQRAVKPKEVEKWKKSHFLPFLAIPTCISFGLHLGDYRFMVFPDLGRSLQAVLDERPGHVLSEKTAFHILLRLVDALEFIHDNEYVHGNVSTENIFVHPDTPSQVTLAGYSCVFRYCPGNKHVAYVERKRTPHQGTLEFISLDLHKGIDPSRRSDMQALGYCLLKWLYGALPWTSQLSDTLAVMRNKERFMNNVAELMRQSCGQRKPPEALKTYLNAAMALQYEEKPNYGMLETVLMAALKELRVEPYDSISLLTV
ncbi:inactive serine/threonine-protein kinase VRK3 isoform X1 [Monodelphis domestica]|uniref:inactive serine/threonine-protein kinase VRK3 isoform X1 n=1 Tax=Monodelphis domestica TaxID=13616 RepID=UPI0024E1FC57|nr:inactive serine/threonine-protein kinase VRK3 isoform X1 [Monodelphis domestica]XP_007492320.2 inactive serine/threonine-protein kinase VRK3 isoform X1 [Monodelphis domestica]XP_007492321.2 inactive serine/threonine-protein kinase VRK3 isoform X1 [Monodelphis domestica]